MPRKKHEQEIDDGASESTTTTKSTGNGVIEIYEIETQQIDVCLIGTSPLILNRMSQKVWQELLFPKGRKSTVERQQSMKHDPIREFRDAPYMLPKHVKAPTALGVMASGFKRGMGTAALDIPGAKRTQIGRLVHVPGEYVPVFGLPRVFMSITRSADINHTPDVRTRAILPEWACRITIKFVTSALRQKSITNLLAAAGFVSGLGDWRQEKGSGSFGAYRICSVDDPDFVRITQTMGRERQLEALANPQAYNDETAEMLAWFDIEVSRRGFVQSTSMEIAEGKPIKPFMGQTVNGQDDDELTAEVPAPKPRGRPPGSGKKTGNGHAGAV